MSDSPDITLAIPERAVPALADDWADSTIAEIYDVDDLALLVDAKRKLAAFKRYVARKQDKDEVARTEIECRGHIGDVLGPQPGRGRQPRDVELAAANSGLSSIERHEFRLLSAHRSVYRQLLDEGERRYREIILTIQRWRRDQGLTVDPDYILPPRTRIEHCAMLDLNLGTGTADLIVTDPPYGNEGLQAWEDLGVFAERVLKPGGILVAYSGQMFLPEAMFALNTLDYIWMGAVVHDGAFFQLREHKIQVGWKPLLIYGKSPVKIERWWSDTITEGRREKDYHGWQQAVGEAAAMIEVFTTPGDLVADPMLGGGTTAVAAYRTGRQFVGCDINTRAVQKTRERLHGEQTSGPQQ